ncbi:fimbrial assembly protein fimC [Spirochaetia bacterium]|nr:fimbrial assembly protein fimC [Spirochaetia bacterium]
MHIIGRLTAPIMLFFIVEGYYHTHNLKKYLLRLFVFTILSHFAYVIAFDKSFIPLKETVFDQTSIMWALMLGLLALVIRENKDLKIRAWQKFIIVFILVWLAFPADWSSPAALAIIYMGINHGNFKKQMVSLVICITIYSIVYAVFLNLVYGLLQMFIVLAIPVLYQYNGERGKWKGIKWFFYMYYPLHLMALGIIRIFLLHKTIN